MLHRSGSDRTVGHNWVYRFIKRLPSKLQYKPQYGREYGRQKIKEKSRLDSEDIGRLTLWFRNFSEMLATQNIQPNEIFNWDETGYQIGQGEAQNGILSGSTNPTIGNESTSEFITGIECISADGWAMLPWFLVKETQHTSIQIPNFRIQTTPTGWVNDETALEWLRSFNEATKTRVRSGRPRVLMMDNRPSHISLEFMEFCKANFILPIWFIPHTAPICQPLDGQPFQYLTHYLRTANNEAVMWDGTASQKRDFFRIIGDIRSKVFTQRTIRSAFKSCGIWPLNSEIILEPLRAQVIQDAGVPPINDTPSIPREFPSPATNLPLATSPSDNSRSDNFLLDNSLSENFLSDNSPPDTIERVSRLNADLLKEIESMKAQNQEMQRCMQRSMDANALLAQRLELFESALKEFQSAATTSNAAN
ncbi:hypothetical protein N7457_003573 [Penicillium paradoxum]|uniref:uncharacterized protein n=1 Tax=Penicillium paradoxum TaxID=176176 RepID=UPI00254847D1|nr:uncharacterized protein N7457_003573 [Penicillium paradoxum]KAJ5788583.1 hypothetical protein N7457_003573 [Penicillium paradoxum]